MSPRRTSSTLGDKVDAWLRRQRKQRLAPSTERALAEDLGIHHSTVGAWIKEDRRPRSDILHRLALVMGVDQDWLTDDTASTDPPPRKTEGLLPPGLTAEQEQAVRAALQDPNIVRALIAFGRANA